MTMCFSRYLSHRLDLHSTSVYNINANISFINVRFRAASNISRKAGDIETIKAKKITKL